MARNFIINSKFYFKNLLENTNIYLIFTSLLYNITNN